MKLISDTLMERHDPGPGHPERPDRLRAVVDRLARLKGPTWVTPRAATQRELERVHTPAHVHRVLGTRGHAVRFDADTETSPGSVTAAERAAGAAIEAVDSALAGESAFALVRPPGHHAEAARAMGFCLFNNVAVAAAHAVSKGLERVLILDWDVHHGNGTQHIFEADPRVLFFSTHRSPFYPGTGQREERGRGAGQGHTHNVPLPAGCTDGDYAMAFDALFTPVAEAFRPQLVLVSAGFDAHADDPIGGMRVSADGFAWMCERVMKLGAPAALVLEGGYDLEALARSAEACTRVLLGETGPERPTHRSSAGERQISAYARSSG